MVDRYVQVSAVKRLVEAKYLTFFPPRIFFCSEWCTSHSMAGVRFA